ncbi:MAG: hypothetical protein PVI01_16565 [Gemmatimonadales bacterium]
MSMIQQTCTINRALRTAKLLVTAGLLQLLVSAGASAQQDSLFVFPQEFVNAVLDSLERVALTSNDHDQRVTAVLGVSAPGRFWLYTQPGAEEPPAEIRYPGIVDRLARIYRQSDDYWLQLAIIDLMALQAERARAVDFLEQVARESHPEDAGTEWPLPLEAVIRLAEMGAEGRAAVERLHAQNAVRNPSARAHVEGLIRRGFKKPGS